MAYEKSPIDDIEAAIERSEITELLLSLMPPEMLMQAGPPMGPMAAGPMGMAGPEGAVPPGAMPPEGEPMPPEAAPEEVPPEAAGAMPPGAMPPGAMPPGAIPPGAMPPEGMPPEEMPPEGMPPEEMPPEEIPPEVAMGGGTPLIINIYTEGAPVKVAQNTISADLAKTSPDADIVSQMRGGMPVTPRATTMAGNAGMPNTVTQDLNKASQLDEIKAIAKTGAIEEV